MQKRKYANGEKTADLNLYDQLEKITGEPLAWGMLTGASPVQLAMHTSKLAGKKKIISDGHGKAQA